MSEKTKQALDMDVKVEFNIRNIFNISETQLKILEDIRKKFEELSREQGK